MKKYSPLLIVLFLFTIHVFAGDDEPKKYFPQVGDPVESLGQKMGPPIFVQPAEDVGGILVWMYHPKTGNFNDLEALYLDQNAKDKVNTVVLYVVENRVRSILIVEGTPPGPFFGGFLKQSFKGIDQIIQEEAEDRANPKPIEFDEENVFLITVKEGDTLQNIADMYLMTAEYLGQLNGLETNSKLKAGQKLKIPEVKD